MYYNGAPLPVRDFQSYVDMYLGPRDSGAPRVYERFGDRWEVCVSATDGQFQQVRARWAHAAGAVGSRPLRAAGGSSGGLPPPHAARGWLAVGPLRAAGGCRQQHVAGGLLRTGGPRICRASTALGPGQKARREKTSAMLR